MSKLFLCAPQLLIRYSAILYGHWGLDESCGLEAIERLEMSQECALITILKLPITNFASVPSQ